jgi:hypothetical protein
MLSKSLTIFALPLVMIMLLNQAMADPTHPKKSKKTASDKELIARTLTYYFEGANLRALSAVESACHPEARFTHFNPQTGHLEAQTVHDVLHTVKSGKNTQTQNLRLLSLDIEKNVAMAKIRLEETQTRDRSIHYLQLVRVGDQWRIVSETTFRKDS